MDRSRGRWVWVRLDDAGEVTAGSVDRLSRLPDAEITGIDIPLWLPSGSERRTSEREARRRLGRRSSTVFPTFPSWVYEWPKGYEPSLRAAAASRLGRRPSAQSFHLGPAILEARVAKTDTWIEVHPELAFRIRSDREVPSKRTEEGVSARSEILEREGIGVPAMDERVPIDDLLDAAICTVVSRAALTGRAVAHGDPASGDVIWG